MWKKMVAIVVVVAMLFGGVAVGMQGAFAAGDGEEDANVCNDDKISNELKKLAGCKLDEDKTIVSAAVKWIELAITLAGIVAVGVVVYGGFTYVTSVGDAAKVAKAKHIILYGIVGMLVAVLAFVIVNFVSVSISD